MKKTILILVGFFFCNFIFAQENTANIWYFADHAGINFNTGVPIAVTDGQTDIIEGCATLCDINGDLLFYTDGMTVWNKNQQIMPNGTGLMGNPSATQSAIITPYPQNDSLYIVFTVDARENSLQNGLRYSIINLNLDNGLGDITSIKNILLSAPVSERITSINYNQYDYWIIAHEWGTDNFLSYSVTNTGVNTTPVISSIGCVNTGGSFPMQHSIGYMKSTINGQRIAVANYRDAGFFELFDFDKTTGLLSNVETSATNYYRPYGVEFSPNGNYLYGSIDGSEFSNGKVYQFDLTQTNPLSNPVLIGSSTYHTPGLQLGPNAKIYVSIKNYGYLGVINNPDISGVNCNFIHDAVYLEGKIAWRGLPSLYYYHGFQFFTGSEQDTSICEGDSIFLENHWQTEAGTYYDTLFTSLGWDSIVNTHLTILPIPQVPTISEISGVLISSSALDYQWYFNGSEIVGAINQQYQPMVSGIYQVSVDNGNGCLSFSEEYYYELVNIESLKEDKLLIYPNPVKTNIKIISEEIFSFKLFDTKGLEVLIDNAKTNKKLINISNLNKGVYLLKMIYNDKIISKKIIKE